MTAKNLQLASPFRVSRTAAIALLRAALLELVDDDRSICQVAAERGIFCRGFRRYSDEEFRQRYWWLAGIGLTRKQIEQRANLWQLARQLYHDVPLACDVQQRDRDACNGWDDFSNQTLAEFYRELTGLELEITS